MSDGYILALAIVALVFALICVLAYLGRDKKTLSTRFGFFIERERVPQDPGDAPTRVLWPGEKKEGSSDPSSSGTPRASSSDRP